MDRQSELRAEIGKLVEKKRDILRKAGEAQRIYQERQNELGPEIEQLQGKAETLATEFRRLYEEASTAYEAGEGALAKVLSEAGHEAQDRCEAINAAANRYRRELKRLRQIYLDYYQKAKDIDLKINELQNQLSHERRNLVATFPSPEATERFLARMPQAALEKIATIKYSRERTIGRFGNELAGKVRYNPDLRAYEIEIYRHDGRSENIRETIAHEVGHVAYSKLSPEEVQEWAKLHETTTGSYKWLNRYTIRDQEEDFCECFAKFFTDKAALVKVDERKYSFVKKINDRLRGVT